MAHCWEEYMWKVHNAAPLDPWAANVQVLDVLIQERTSFLWLPPWLHQHKLASSLSRAGSMSSLGTLDSCRPQAVVEASGSEAIGNNGAPIQKLDINSGSAGTIVQSIDNSIGSGEVRQGSPNIDSATNSDTSNRPQPQKNIINGGSSTRLSSHILDSNTKSRSSLPNTDDGKSDRAQVVKGDSGNSSLNKNTPKSNTTGLMGAINGFIDKARPAQFQHKHRNADSGTERLIHKTLCSMPDIQATIRSSTSLLTSFTGGSSATAVFDIKGSKTVTCNVGGVNSRRVDVDAIMEMVTPRTSCGRLIPSLWRPDTSLPQLQWSVKRGQILWVVTEIMYANSIKVEVDKEEKASGKAKVSKGEGVDVSEQVGVEKDGVWTVTAPKDNSAFPFALRLQRLAYDGHGNLIVASNKHLTRNNSIHKNKPMRLLSSKPMDALYRSSSVSHRLP